MNKEQILSAISGRANKIGFGLKKYSPEILVVTGVIGIVGSTVLACRSTLKVASVLDDHKTKINAVNEAKEAIANGTVATEEYTEQDQKRDLTVIYAQTAINVLKVYAPSIVLGALSITCILASNNILRKRNVALAAAYATIDKGFKEYRDRVVERFGKEVDRELKYNLKAQKIEEIITDEDGKEKKVKSTVNVAGIDGYSDYARFFDESSQYWEKNPEYNLMFLRSRQEYANQLLRVNGRLFLNDVYKMLDIPETKAGQVVGWIYDDKNPNGDNYIDFGMYDMAREKVRDFVNGYERVVLLDFNVDGNIWDKM